MRNLLTAVFLISWTFVFSQVCGTTGYMENLIHEHPEVGEELSRIENHTQQITSGNFKTTADDLIIIPVVVHVVYKNNNENISESQVLSQIRILNEDFRKLNSDSNTYWSQADDSRIQFCLAQFDPQGNPTTGITRKSTTRPYFSVSQNDIKFNSSGGQNAWPRADYLNIWVGDISQGILGYAQFPGGPAATDGVVIDYKYFGDEGTATNPFHLGRTATHEVGHWLNLYHIWGDGGCGSSDYVGDTPDADGPNYGCQVGSFSCGTEDMYENYMDYSNDICLNLFTTGQKDRMRALFASGGARESLLNSDVCGVASYSCFDGLMNGNETGIDCGGPECEPCAPIGDCHPPRGLVSQPLNDSGSVKLSWDPVASANTYTVRFKKENQTSYRDTITRQTSIVIKDLFEGELYEWYVKANCTDVVSDSSYQIFEAGKSVIEGVGPMILYPNPTYDWISIEFENEYEGATSLTLYDVSGRFILKRSEYFNLGDVVYSIDLNHLKSGMYILRMENGRNNHVFKILKF